MQASEHWESFLEKDILLFLVKATPKNASFYGVTVTPRIAKMLHLHRNPSGRILP